MHDLAPAINRRTLFESETLQIGLFEARPVSDACSDVEQQSLNAVVLPFSGVFAKHEAPGRHVIGTPSHAVFIGADTPYRIGFPGAIGDRALIVRFDHDLVPDQLDSRSGRETRTSYGLLPANAMMLRNLLCARLQRGDIETFESEALGLDLLAMSLESMCAGHTQVRRSTLVRRRHALERVKLAVASSPADKWNIARLAKIANLSPFHLCRVFRQMVGTSVYDYVLYERLAQTLDAVLDKESDLTAVALDAGFFDHSHFTARFKGFFGLTPATLRRIATTSRVAELRKIVTAQRR